MPSYQHQKTKTPESAILSGVPSILAVEGWFEISKLGLLKGLNEMSDFMIA